MLRVTEIRLWNARLLADRAGGVVAFALQIGRDKSLVSQWLGTTPSKGIGHRSAAIIESAAGQPRGWLDVARWPEWRTIRHPEWRELLPTSSTPVTDELAAIAANLSDEQRAQWIEYGRRLGAQTRKVTVPEGGHADAIADYAARTARPPKKKAG